MLCQYNCIISSTAVSDVLKWIPTWTACWPNPQLQKYQGSIQWESVSIKSILTHRKIFFKFISSTVTCHCWFIFYFALFSMHINFITYNKISLCLKNKITYLWNCIKRRYWFWWCLHACWEQAKLWLWYHIQIRSNIISHTHSGCQ